MLLGGWGEIKRKRAGHDGKGEERREDSVIYCGVAVLWFWLWFWMLLNAVVKIIVLKGSIRNLMGFRFCFTVFLQFMFFVFGAVVRHLG